MMEWNQCSGEKSQQQLLETQLSYETEWDMINAVSFRKKPCTNGESESSSSTLIMLSHLLQVTCRAK